MTGIVVGRGLRVGGGPAIYTEPFTLAPPADKPQVTFVLVVREHSGAGATWHVRLQEKAQHGWDDVGTVISAGMPLSNGVHYTIFASPPSSTLRVEVLVGESGSNALIDLFASDTSPDPGFATTSHSIVALGGATAAQLPQIQGALEDALRVAVRLDGVTPSPEIICGFWSPHFDPPTPVSPPTVCNVLDVHYDATPQARAAGETNLRMPASLLRYLLATRIEHTSVSDDAMRKVALEARVSDVDLRSQIDRLNALADVLLRIALDGRGSSRV
jgi:hypothetical protein